MLKCDVNDVLTIIECKELQDFFRFKMIIGLTLVKSQLCEDTGCSPEDQSEAINDREKWRERVRDIHASCTTWWWWWWLGLTTKLAGAVEYTNCISAEIEDSFQRVQIWNWIILWRDSRLGIWGILSTSSLPSLLGSFWPGVVAPDIYGPNRAGWHSYFVQTND